MRLKQKLCCRAGHETWGVGFGGSEGEVKIYSQQPCFPGREWPVAAKGVPALVGGWDNAGSQEREARRGRSVGSTEDGYSRGGEAAAHVLLPSWGKDCII